MGERRKRKKRRKKLPKTSSSASSRRRAVDQGTFEYAADEGALLVGASLALRGSQEYAGVGGCPPVGGGHPEGQGRVRAAHAGGEWVPVQQGGREEEEENEEEE